MKKLKPCPFCGAEKKQLDLILNKQNDKSIIAIIDCLSCGVSFNFGLFGSGISRPLVKKMVVDQYNIRY